MTLSGKTQQDSIVITFVLQPRFREGTSVLDCLLNIMETPGVTRLTMDVVKGEVVSSTVHVQLPADEVAELLRVVTHMAFTIPELRGGDFDRL